MSGLKSFMIDTLRDSSESKAVWQLRRAFLHRNLEPQMHLSTKEHIIYLSHAFVDTNLNRSQDYSREVVKEVHQRTRGMTEDIQKATRQLEHPSENFLCCNGSHGFTSQPGACDWIVQSVIPDKKVVGKTGINTKEKKEKAMVWEKDGKKTKEEEMVVPKKRKKRNLSEVMDKEEKQFAKKKKIDNFTTSLGALNLSSNFRTGPPADCSSPVGPRLVSPWKYFQQNYYEQNLDPQYSDNSQNPHYQKDPYHHPQNLHYQQDSYHPQDPYHQQDPYHLQNLHHQQDPYHQQDPDHQQNLHHQQDPYPDEKNFHQQNGYHQENPLYLQEKSYTQDKIYSVQKSYPPQKPFLNPQQNHSPRLSLTAQPEKKPAMMLSSPHESKVCRMVPGLPVDLFEHPLAKPLCQDSLQKATSSKGPDNTLSPAFTGQSEAGGKAPMDGFGKSPAFDRDQNAATTAVGKETTMTERKEIKSSSDYVSKIAFDESQNLTVVNTEKLNPVRDIANFYSEMENKDTIEPFSALKRCAAGTRHKLKFDNRRVLSKGGAKSVSCSAIIGDVCISTIVVPLGTSPNAAHQQLAASTFDKICSPYLRLVSKVCNGGFVLEGSKTPFNKGGIKTKTSPENNVEDQMATDFGVAELSESSDPAQGHGLDGERVGIETNASSPGKEQIMNAMPVMTPPVTPSISTDRRRFDSFVAWVTEKDPTLKNIRYLGHLYCTLPYAKIDASTSIMLKFLSKASGIPLDMVPAQPHFTNSSAYTFKIVMDHRILLTCSSSHQEQDAIELACEGVLKKIVMKHLCLKSNALLASQHPFPQLTAAECESEGIIYDNWDVESQKKPEQNVDSPPRFCNFYLFTWPNKHDSAAMLESGAMHNRHISVETIHEKKVRKPIPIRIMKMEGQEIGRTRCPGKKKARKIVGEESFKNLRECHWLLFRVKENKKREKAVSVEELMEFLPGGSSLANSSNPGNLSSANKGYKLMTKMGWQGGRIGKYGTGIAEPISVQMLQRNSGLGFQQDKRRGELSCNNVPMTHVTLIQAFADSPFIHRCLFIPFIHNKDVGSATTLANKLDLVIKVKGKKVKSATLWKKSRALHLFYDVLKAGGVSNEYKLLPPERKPTEPTLRKIKHKTASKTKNENEKIQGDTDNVSKTGSTNASRISTKVQCSLVNLLPLKKLKQGTKAVIVHEESAEELEEKDEEPDEESAEELEDVEREEDYEESCGEVEVEEEDEESSEEEDGKNEEEEEPGEELEVKEDEREKEEEEKPGEELEVMQNNGEKEEEEEPGIELEVREEEDEKEKEEEEELGIELEVREKESEEKKNEEEEEPGVELELREEDEKEKEEEGEPGVILGEREKEQDDKDPGGQECRSVIVID